MKIVQTGPNLFFVPLTDGLGFSPHDPSYSRADSIAVYDMLRNKWKKLSLPHPRMGVTPAAALNKIYFAGGYDMQTAKFTDDIDILTINPRILVSAANCSTACSFGNVLLNEEKVTELKISNEGDYYLIPSGNTAGISIQGDTADFTIDLSAINDTLDPGSSWKIPVRFRPKSEGNKKLFFSISANDPETPIYTYLFEGNGDISTGTFITKSNDKQVKVFPNPATDILVIRKNQNITEADIRIEDMHGITILQQQFNQEEISINVSKIPSGVYNLILESDAETSAEKIVILHD